MLHATPVRNACRKSTTRNAVFPPRRGGWNRRSRKGASRARASCRGFCWWRSAPPRSGGRARRCSRLSAPWCVRGSNSARVRRSTAPRRLRALAMPRTWALRPQRLLFSFVLLAAEAKVNCFIFFYLCQPRRGVFCRGGVPEGLFQACLTAGAGSEHTIPVSRKARPGARTSFYFRTLVANLKPWFSEPIMEICRQDSTR